MFKIRRQGIAELQDGLSDGLEAVDDELLNRARAQTSMFKEPSGAILGSLRTNKTHSREWPRAAVFVTAPSGDSFHVHEGTSDTPAQPFLSIALDGMRNQIPSIMRSKSKR